LPVKLLTVRSLLSVEAGETLTTENPLRAFFNQRTEGRGIWKWDHYFDVYDRHFRRFRDIGAHVLEIGVYSGGSLDMWAAYFGPNASIYGVDIQPNCKAYESDQVKIFTGDQGDRDFWRSFRKAVPKLDIVIDDGSHLPEHQQTSIEELLPHLTRGGVYLCEDVAPGAAGLTPYIDKCANRLNAYEGYADDLTDAAPRISCTPNKWQQVVQSIHLYPYVVVIEKNAKPMSELVAPKHGTEWKPFYREL